MGEKLTTPVPAPVSWKTADFAGETSWIYHLPAKALGDIDRALARVTQKGLGMREIGKVDFALPAIASDLADLLQEVETGRGFVLIRGVPVERYTVAQIETIFWGIGTHFGAALSQTAQGERMVQIFDRGNEYGAANVRGYTTRGGQQFHTDSVPDIVALLCVRKAKSGGESRIASAMAVYNEFLMNYPPEYLDQLYEGFYYDRRGEVIAGMAPITEHRVPAFSFHAGALRCSFAHVTITQAAKKSGKNLTSFETEVLDAFDEIAARPEMRLDMDLQPGDVQILNNATVLHSRTGWEDFDEPERKRVMLRLWLESVNPRPRVPAHEVWNAYGVR